MLTLILFVGCSTLAHAQDNGGRAKRQASAQRDKPAKKAKRARADRKRGKAAAEAPKDAPKAEQAVPAETRAPDAEPAREGERAQGEKQPAAAESETDQADVHDEGGTQVKVMEFSGLDIEGQLKTPQMLYFLNRLRAEFGRPRLPHRSFMPELQAGTADKAMR